MQIIFWHKNYNFITCKFFLLLLVHVQAAAKPVYSTNTTNYATPRVVAQQKVQAPIQASSAATYVYPTAVTTPQVSSYSTTYAGNTNATTTVSYTSKGKDNRKAVLVTYISKSLLDGTLNTSLSHTQAEVDTRSKKCELCFLLICIYKQK